MVHYAVYYKDFSGFEIMLYDNDSIRIFINKSDAKDHLLFQKSLLQNLLKPYDIKKYLWFTYKVYRPKLQEFEIRDINRKISTMFIKAIHL